MKVLAASIFVFLTHAALAQTVVPSPVDHIFVPKGFDDNDAVEVVVTGKFPNLCYSRNQVSVKQIDKTILIDVTALTREAEASCPQMLVPFKEVVTVGNLAAGDYKIIVNQNSADSLSAELAVTTALHPGTDEYFYAAVEWVEQKSKQEFVLHGWRYSACLKLDRIEAISNGKDTLSVLPIMKQVSDFCPMKGVPESYNAKLDLRKFKVKEALLHIRTMDGKSVNTLVKLKD